MMQTQKSLLFFYFIHVIENNYLDYLFDKLFNLKNQIYVFGVKLNSC